MPRHWTRYVDVMPVWLREPQVPVQAELPGVSGRVVRTPGQSGTTGERATQRETGDTRTSEGHV